MYATKICMTNTQLSYFEDFDLLIEAVPAQRKLASRDVSIRHPRVANHFGSLAISQAARCARDRHHKSPPTSHAKDGRVAAPNLRTPLIVCEIRMNLDKIIHYSMIIEGSTLVALPKSIFRAQRRTKDHCVFKVANVFAGLT